MGDWIYIRPDITRRLCVNVLWLLSGNRCVYSGIIIHINSCCMVSRRHIVITWLYVSIKGLAYNLHGDSPMISTAAAWLPRRKGVIVGVYLYNVWVSLGNLNYCFWMKTVIKKMLDEISSLSYKNSYEGVNYYCFWKFNSVSSYPFVLLDYPYLISMYFLGKLKYILIQIPQLSFC